MPGMTVKPQFSIREVDWTADRDALRAVRWKVFVEEQHVPEDEEWDEHDPRCRHVIAAAADGTPIGTGRLLPDGHIGRMAVLKEWRGRGIGSALLSRLLQLSREARHEVTRLHAQTHALGFYERHGFIAEGEEFMEAGIPHFVMVRNLAADKRR
jgi:predicted GNAT family N-acyltransferase